MNLGDHLGRGRYAGADGPARLICDDDVFMRQVEHRQIRFELFDQQSDDYRAKTIGNAKVKVAIEAGIRQGWLKSPVSVHTRGGDLVIAWTGMGQPVFMTGPAETVFEGEIDI